MRVMAYLDMPDGGLVINLHNDKGIVYRHAVDRLLVAVELAHRRVGLVHECQRLGIDAQLQLGRMSAEKVRNSRCVCSALGQGHVAAHLVRLAVEMPLMLIRLRSSVAMTLSLRSATNKVTRTL